VWLWPSATGASPADIDRLWQAFPRRFDREHTFRLIKQILGWTRPENPHPRNGRPLDLARHHRAHPTPDRPPSPKTTSPPAHQTQQTRPGRTPGSKNHRPAQLHNVGKSVKGDTALTTGKSNQINENRSECFQISASAWFRAAPPRSCILLTTTMPSKTRMAE
jgi:hypothetical protein